MTSENITVITMDLQAVLLCPSLKASALYYKTKLSCHDFTIYDMKTRNVFCYFWTESEGDQTSNSCVFDYVSEIDETVKTLII
jgi:hypothetical protein